MNSSAQPYWITVRTDGRPHAVPLVGVWHDGAGDRPYSLPELADAWFAKYGEG